jgi:uncharacterized DUF497 family protein
MRFEWDDRTAFSNLEKHGVGFDEAKEVFHDPNAIEDYDVVHSVDDSRFSIIGFSSRRLLYVVHAERTADLIWIISARKAHRADKEVY